MTSEPKSGEPDVTPAMPPDAKASTPAAAVASAPAPAPVQPPEPAATAEPAAPAEPEPGLKAKAYVDPSIEQEATIAKLEHHVKDLTDRLLRAHAEMDNIRKRTERDKTDTIKYAITKFAGDIVTVGDNFQRAISAVPAGAADAVPAFRSLIEGVTLIEREFLGVLERHGVKRIDPKGRAFDPNFHQAVMEQDNREVAAGTVLQVFQAGYVIEDRILRPAMVVVSKGGAKPARTMEPKAKPDPDDADPASEVPEVF